MKVPTGKVSGDWKQSDSVGPRWWSSTRKVRGLANRRLLTYVRSRWVEGLISRAACAAKGNQISHSYPWGGTAEAEVYLREDGGTERPRTFRLRRLESLLNLGRVQRNISENTSPEEPVSKKHTETQEKRPKEGVDGSPSPEKFGAQGVHFTSWARVVVGNPRPVPSCLTNNLSREFGLVV